MTTQTPAPPVQMVIGEAEHSVSQVANYFLNRSQNDSRPSTDVTHLKLQKLAYYAQAWHVTILRRRLFAERIEAWVHGPVSPDLYSEYRHYGYQSIYGNILGESQFNEQTLGVLNAVWITYGDKDAKELEKLTHSEEPWKLARGNMPATMYGNNEISVEGMANYYSRYYQ
ncbi:TPA: Panacea domain-containing protein [Bacillus cereus]